MKSVTERNPKASFESFEGVYCSGFFVTDPSLLTAICLLFDKVHILNHLEYVIDFSKKFRVVFPKGSKLLHQEVKLEPMSPDAEEEPFSTLTPEQRRTANAYLLLATQFLVYYAPLFGEVFHSGLRPDDEVMDVKLIKRGVAGKKNLYRVTVKPLIVGMGEGALEELDGLISCGAIPILGKYHAGSRALDKESLTSRYLASLLAMKSVELVLPRTKAANAETILEARERLRDYLPPFWSSMLKLSREFKSRVREGMPAVDLQRECGEIIDTVVRPALIDLNQKLLKERRNWFYKIITPAARGLKVMVGRPPLTTADLISSGIALGTNVAIDVAEQMRKVNAVSQESGLTLLLELEKLTREAGKGLE
jgi:hypothetical protein